MIKVINVVGARPNFMKIAPIINAMKKYSHIIEGLLVHTGQHYDENMSKLFIRDLELPEPDIYLGVGSGSHAEQTAKIIVEFEKIILHKNPDLVLVVGDVNSTIACALVASKLNIPVAHVEAGLRSFDRRMPEEINRILTDAISEYLFITEKSAQINLLNEGKSKERIFFVGNVMVDTLLRNKNKADSSKILSELNLKTREYSLLTLHRPENVDTKQNLEKIILALEEVEKHIQIVFPVHPRTQKKLQEFGLARNNGFKLTQPLGYLDFLKLMIEAKFVLTDSGGIQEETTILKIPCLTLRENTERPVTISEGTNILVGTDRKRIIKESLDLLKGKQITPKTPELWDGKTAERIVEILIHKFNKVAGRCIHVEKQ